MPTYPLTWPAQRVPSSLILTASHAAATTVSQTSFAGQVQDRLGARWEASVHMPPLTREQSAELRGFLVALHGVVGTFTMGVWDELTPLGAGGTGIKVKTTPGVRDLVLATKGWGVSSTVMKAGEFLSLQGSAARLYQTVADVVSDSSGDATIQLWPPIREAYPVDTAVNIATPVGTWRLSSSPSFSFHSPIRAFTDISLDIEEALP